MHINFKYFIVSIGSIFLALGIGILVGANLGSSDNMERQNEAIIKDIDTKFKQLKEKDDKLVSENDQYKKSVSNLEKIIGAKFGEMTQNSIDGMSVGIVSFTSNDYTLELENSLTSAGGNIAFDIQINPSVLEQSSLEKVNEKLSKNFKKNDELIEYIVNEIKKYDFTTNTLSDLQTLGIINIKSFSKSYSDSKAVVIANNTTKDAKKLSKAEIPMTKLFSEDKKVVAVQTKTAETSLLDIYTQQGVSTIPNADTAVGRYALVLWLQNPSNTGRFGIVDQNSVLIPDVR